MSSNKRSLEVALWQVYAALENMEESGYGLPDGVKFRGTEDFSEEEKKGWTEDEKLMASDYQEHLDALEFLKMLYLTVSDTLPSWLYNQEEDKRVEALLKRHEQLHEEAKERHMAQKERRMAQAADISIRADDLSGIPVNYTHARIENFQFDGNDVGPLIGLIVAFNDKYVTVNLGRWGQHSYPIADVELLTFGLDDMDLGENTTQGDTNG